MLFIILAIYRGYNAVLMHIYLEDGKETMVNMHKMSHIDPVTSSLIPVDPYYGPENYKNNSIENSWG